MSDQLFFLALCRSPYAPKCLSHSKQIARRRRRRGFVSRLCLPLSLQDPRRHGVWSNACMSPAKPWVFETLHQIPASTSTLQQVTTCHLFKSLKGTKGDLLEGASGELSCQSYPPRVVVCKKYPMSPLYQHPSNPRRMCS